MANVLVLGGGFGGVVAAESLAQRLAPEHEITLVSRDRNFIFYPSLVRLAFGHCEPADVSFDLNSAMLERRIRFVQGEVARVDPHSRRAVIAHGQFEGEISYDYLIFATGRRLATERVPGFFEHAHHLLSVDAALRFGEALRGFREGRAIIGYCPGARLAVPVYETAFALSRLVEELGMRDRVRITLASPEPPGDELGGAKLAHALHAALVEHRIEFLPDFPINYVAAGAVRTSRDQYMKYDLLMLVPPFQGASAMLGTGTTDDDGYIRVDKRMRVEGAERMYAAGDAVSFEGPKMGHMAVRQGEVAAANVAAEIEGRAPESVYDHEMMLVIDEGGRDSIYLHKKMWTDEPISVRQGRFWSWAKRVHENYWQQRHS
jgi:sulfide:quinone oxidoreductase